jgi:hypothetical protein
MPGAGKTIMASIVVNHLRTSFPDDKTGTAALYCTYKRQDNQKVDDLLASLLGQLAVGQSVVPEFIGKLYDQHQKGENPQFDTRQALRTIIKTYSRTFIIIDGFDECRTDHIRNELLSEVYKLQEGSDTRLMATFRAHLPPKFPSSVTELEIRAHQEDVKEYLSGRMSELRTVVQGNTELQDTIKTRILALVDGRYVRLHPLASSLILLTVFKGSFLHNSTSTCLRTNSRKNKSIPL